MILPIDDLRSHVPWCATCVFVVLLAMNSSNPKISYSKVAFAV